MRRSLLVLLWCDLAIWAGFFAVMPYLPDRMTQLGHSGTVVGLILAVRLLAQQGTMPVSGVLADRWGYRRSLLYGLGLRAAGFAFLAEAHALPMLALAAVLSGVGGSLIGAAFKGAYASTPGEENLAARFLWLAMVDRLGQAVGPLLGQAAGSFVAQGGVGVGLFLGVGLVVWLWVPESQGAPARAPVLASLRAQVRNTRLVWLVAVLCGYWALQQQMSVLVPLAAAQIGRREQVGPLFSLSAMAGLLLVLLLPRLRMDQLWSRLLLAQGVTAGSMALPVLLPGFPGIVAVTVGLAVAAVLGQPAMDALVGSLAPEGARASAYGFAALSFGVGGAAGQVLGGWSWSLGQQGAPWLPWLLFTLMGSLTLAALYVLRKDVDRYDRLPECDDHRRR